MRIGIGSRSGRLVLAQKVCRWMPPILSARLGSVIYPQRMAFRDDFAFTVRAQTGSRFSGRTSDFHGYPFSVHGFYDWRNWAVAGALCSRGDTLIEIGANVGTETVGFRDIVGDTGKIFAFEPVPSNLESLQTLVTLNGWTNVHVLPLALGDLEGDMSFALPSHKHASGEGHIVLDATAAGSGTVRVQCVRLDSMTDQIGRARAIFCDAEGAETMIIRGGRQYVRRHQSAIILEASPKLLARSRSSLQELHDELRALDYQCFVIGRFNVKAVPGVWDKKAHNWLCLHKSEATRAGECSRAIRRCALLPCIRGLNPLCLENGETLKR